MKTHKQEKEHKSWWTLPTNKYNAPVIGTGDLSELALGWATYNGDHMSMYAVNSGVPKTIVQLLVNYIAKEKDMGEEISKILFDVLDTPISPSFCQQKKMVR